MDGARHLDANVKIPSAFIGRTEILDLIDNEELEIDPLLPELISWDKIDLRIGSELVRLKSTDTIFDVRGHDDKSMFFQRERASEFVINLNERVLMCTIERVRLPTNILGIVGLKSSFSRLGLQSNMGLVDPGFSGQLTLEVTGSAFPIRLRSGESMFHMALASLRPENTHIYSGKYRNQTGPTIPRFDVNSEP